MCRKPVGIMDQEAGYVSSLQTARKFEIRGDYVLLFDADGKPILVFRPKKSDGQGS